jgi:hypothetical protein
MTEPEPVQRLAPDIGLAGLGGAAIASLRGKVPRVGYGRAIERRRDLVEESDLESH